MAATYYEKGTQETTRKHSLCPPSPFIRRSRENRLRDMPHCSGDLSQWQMRSDLKASSCQSYQAIHILACWLWSLAGHAEQKQWTLEQRGPSLSKSLIQFGNYWFTFNKYKNGYIQQWASRQTPSENYTSRFKGLENEDGGLQRSLCQRLGLVSPLSFKALPDYCSQRKGKASRPPMQNWGRNQIPTVGLHAHLSCSTMSKQGQLKRWQQNQHVSHKNNTKGKQTSMH